VQYKGKQRQSTKERLSVIVLLTLPCESQTQGIYDVDAYVQVAPAFSHHFDA
jgi:hypothetical protein